MKSLVISAISVGVALFLASNPDVIEQITTEKPATQNFTNTGLYKIDRVDWNECLAYMELDEKDWDYNKCWNNPDKNKRVGEVYKSVVIPRQIRYVGYYLPDTKEVRNAVYHTGIGTVKTAWSEQRHNLDTDWKEYLPQSTVKFIKDNEKTDYFNVR